jgi:ribosomal protein L3 glutamine methyltransferase
MTEHAVLVLEIGHEWPHFDAAFPTLETVWLPTSAGEDQVLLLTREALAR